MNKKVDVHNFWRSNIFIILIFSVMSILSGIYMYHSHVVGIPNDLEFHWQRIYEIRNSIIHGYFPSLIAENYFSQSGSAVMSMYPQYNLLLMVILSFIFKSSINLFYIAFIMLNFLSLLISYYSSYFYNKSRRISFIFAVVYIINVRFIMYYYAIAYSIGTITAISCLPLVLFGFLSLLNKNKWVELSIGLSLIFLSHVISSGLSLLFLAMMFILNIYKFKNYKKILSLAKAMVITLLITSVFWIPFSIISINNKLFLPRVTYMAGDSFQTVFSILDNGVNTSVTLVCLIGLVLCILNYRKLSSESKQLFWISVVFLLMSTKLFPWNIANSTMLIHLQFPYRLNIIPQLLLCYLFAKIFNLIIKDNKRYIVIISFVILATVTLQMDAQKLIISGYSNNPELTTPFNNNVGSVLKTDDEFNNILYSKSSSNDYYPKAALNSVNDISNHIATYDNGKQLSVSLGGNGKFSFNSPKKINKLSLPFLYYNGIDYQVKLDGKTVKGYPNKNALITINNVRKGKHHVQIIVHKTKAEIVSYILSLIGLLILIGAIFKNFIIKRKIE